MHTAYTGYVFHLKINGKNLKVKKTFDISYLDLLSDSNDTAIRFNNINEDIFQHRSLLYLPAYFYPEFQEDVPSQEPH